MSNKFKREDMQRRFWELTVTREQFFEENAGLYRKRDTMAAELGPLEDAFKALKRSIKDVERPVLPELDEERAMLARALGKNVGNRPEVEGK